MTEPTTPVGVEMTDRAARSFLASRDNGVLSLGVDDDGYGFPIAYSFAPDDDQLVLGFVTRPQSKKREFADQTDTATFTVYEFGDVDVWRSVVVEGPIDRIDDADDASHRVPDVFYERAGEHGDEIVNLDEFDRTWYALDIDSISGRESGRQS